MIMNKEIMKFVLDNTKNSIMKSFDINDKCIKTITITKLDDDDNNNLIYEIIIIRNCYYSNIYYDDYCIHFIGIIKRKKIKSSFYMEWKDNKPGGELIPANTRYCSVKNEFSHREIKIRYAN